MKRAVLLLFVLALTLICVACSGPSGSSSLEADDGVVIRRDSVDGVSCLAVPVTAIYYSGDQRGVVRMEDGYSWFVQVKILKKQNGVAYFEPLIDGTLEEGQRVKIFD